MNWLSDNVQKILGTAAAIVAAVISFAATGGLNEIVTAREIQLLALLNVVLGAATAGSGFRVSAQVKTAEAMQVALQTPPPAQGGYVRPAMLALLLIIGFPLATTLPACSTFEQVQKLPLDRQLELAYQTHTEVTLQVAAALDARQISVGTAKGYLDLAEGSRKVLDEARALVGVDLNSAEAQLQLAKDILTRAQAALLKAEQK